MLIQVDLMQSVLKRAHYQHLLTVLQRKTQAVLKQKHLLTALKWRAQVVLMIASPYLMMWIQSVLK